MQPGGGLFLVCIGLGLVAAAALGGGAMRYGLPGGFVAGFLCIPLAITLAHGRFGRPTRLQFVALYGAILLEMAIFVTLGRGGYFRGVPVTAWTTGLTIVALHFIIMRWSHGPWMLRLAVALLLWIALAYGLRLSFAALVIGDGVLKILFGLIMAAPLLGRPDTKTALP